MSIFDSVWNCILIFNETPLICASRDGHTEIVQLLLSQPGIEIDGNGISIQKSIMIFEFNYYMIFQNVFQVHLTALDWAQSKGHQKIVELLSHTNQN